MTKEGDGKQVRHFNEHCTAPLSAATTDCAPNLGFNTQYSPSVHPCLGVCYIPRVYPLIVVLGWDGPIMKYFEYVKDE